MVSESVQAGARSTKVAWLGSLVGVSFVVDEHVSCERLGRRRGRGDYCALDGWARSRRSAWSSRNGRMAWRESRTRTTCSCSELRERLDGDAEREKSGEESEESLGHRC